MTSEKITKYELLDAVYTDDLTSIVNSHICKGAIPFGSPFTDGRTLYQAVVYVTSNKISILETGPM